jgi:DNA polymerase I
MSDRAKKQGGARAHVHIDREVTTEHLRSAEAGLFDELDPMLFLVDGGNLLWRAAHGNPAPFQGADGRDITPLFRFLTQLRRAVGRYGLFSECVVCFDGADAWSDRLEIDATYKANRSYDDKDLSFMGWLPEIRSALATIGVACLEHPRHEADDVIGTIATRAGSRAVRILSTDRDYSQLISATTAVVNTRARPAIIDEAAVRERYLVEPSQWCDLRTLAGDPSDGIPGLSGVGMKRAAEILGGGTLDDVHHAEQMPMIAERWDELMRWRELIRLRTDVDLDWEPTGKATPRMPAASTVCAAYGLV